MLRFKQFIKKDSEQKIPVAMSMHGSIHKKNNKKIPVAMSMHGMWKYKNNNKITENAEDSDEEYSNEFYDELKKQHTDLSKQFKFDPKQKRQIKKYSESSFPTNAALIGYHHFGESADDKTIHGIHIPTLDSVVNNPIGRELTVHSGLGFDPRNQMDSQGRIHFPAYTSTSIHPGVAHDFTGEYTPPEQRHKVKLSLKPHNRGAYLGDYANEEEREFLLPRNTTIKIHKSEQNPDGTWTHHATVEDDVSPEQIERDPKKLSDLHPNFHDKMLDKKSGISEESKQKLLLGKAGAAVRLRKGKGTEEDVGHALSNPDWGTRMLAAKNKKATSDHLHKALQDSDSSVRRAVFETKSPNLSVNHIEKALSDDDSYVRAKAIEHPKATSEHITKVLDDPNEDSTVKANSFHNPNATSEHIEKGLNSGDEHIMCGAARHENATPEQITRAVNHENPRVQESAMANPNANSEHIEKALGSEDKNVRAGAASHKNATVDQLKRALNDENSWVRNRAHDNLVSRKAAE